MPETAAQAEMHNSLFIESKIPGLYETELASDDECPGNKNDGKCKLKDDQSFTEKALRVPVSESPRKMDAG